jgi:hypothetical protein
MACVTLGMSPGSVRKVVGTPRFISGKLMGVFGGAIVKGMMLAGAKGGVPLLWKAIPCATIVVPWGIFASRETVRILKALWNVAWGIVLDQCQWH